MWGVQNQINGFVPGLPRDKFIGLRMYLKFKSPAGFSVVAHDWGSG